MRGHAYDEIALAKKERKTHMMKDELDQRKLLPDRERVELSGYYGYRKRFFAFFLICCAVFVAGFALSAIFAVDYTHLDVKETAPPFIGEVNTDMIEDGVAGTEIVSGTEGGFGNGDTPASPIPEEGIPILTLTLSAEDADRICINNESVKSPALEEIMKTDVSYSVGEAPLVLILHTHTTEGYTEAGAKYISGNPGEFTYTEDPSRSVVAVGKALYETLSRSGIPTVHCRTVHDKEGHSGAYVSAEESIRFFLSHYPSIRYVIDLHRDAIITQEGAYVRSAVDSEEPYAQIMTVVGSDGNGTPCPWERNLSLSLRLRKKLNEEIAGICRPPVLRNASYNQEFSYASLLLEIGTGANSVEEAVRSARLVGEVLAELICK